MPGIEAPEPPQQHPSLVSHPRGKTPSAAHMLEAAASVMARCLLDDCAELATRMLCLSHRGVPIELPVCAEHWHDIDWGVIRRNRWLRAAADPSSGRAGAISAA